MWWFRLIFGLRGKADSGTPFLGRRLPDRQSVTGEQFLDLVAGDGEMPGGQAAGSQPGR
jgi:hypothetical protein